MRKFTFIAFLLSITLPLFSQNEVEVKVEIEDDFAVEETVEEVEDSIVDIDIEWEEYVSEEYSIQLLFPKDSKIETSTNGDWGMLFAKTPNDGVEIHMMASKNKKSLVDNKSYVSKKMGIPSGSFTEVDMRKSNDLSFTVYYAEGIIEQDGYQSAIFVILAQHLSKDISYIFTLYTDKSTFEVYRDDFSYWYENIQGI
jgi:hypothetical protein